MKKSEAEALHRILITRWIREEKPERDGPGEPYNFYEYLRYAESQRADCMDFRSLAGARYDVETWFDDETGQNWTR